MKRLLALAAILAALLAIVASASFAASQRGHHVASTKAHLLIKSGNPRTPIRHVVEIFQENVSFDHYFGTYPDAENSDGENFNPVPKTPAVDGLLPATNSSIPASLRHS